MMLLNHQQRFAQLVALLLQWAFEHGYQITFGECYRTKEQAEWNEQHGKGIANSLHCLRLAIDLNVFQDDALLTTVDQHAPLGTFWKSLDSDARWGGDFVHLPDAGHFSLTWQGVA